MNEWLFLGVKLINPGLDFASQVGLGHFYHIFYEGCLTNFEIGGDGEEASKLYPEAKYKRMDEYLKAYVWWDYISMKKIIFFTITWKIWRVVITK